ncbi:MAG: AAC(3)-I family aminoglycoside N-acetyltransferase [Hyphomicrobiaceae bacterium]
MVASTFTFRRLVRDDVEPLKQLLGVFAEAFEDAETYGGAVPSDDYLATLLGKPHFVAVAAFLEAKVVGGLAAYVLDKFEQDRREIYIYDLAVAEPHRRKGVATGAIGELRRIAADLDVYVIFVQADLEDAPAIALYESLGRKETAHHFDIEVRCSR